MDWENVARAKRQAILDSIPAQWRIKKSDIPSPSQLRDVVTFSARFLTPRELEITNTPAIGLLHAIRTLKWSCVEVTRAFCHRASVAHQLTNCLSEPCFDAAERTASRLDKHLRGTSQPVGPLHGLPISLKDRFNLAGHDSACGYVSWLHHPKTVEDEGVLVSSLKRAGAIIIAKTNVPMSMLLGVTTNNIVGSTLNPYNMSLSAGGASGGEGALLALGGSEMGWGTDIAGSIRIPSSFCGLWALRPSYGRLSSTGLEKSLPGLPIGMSVIGPLTRELETLVLAIRWATGLESWKDDPEAVDLGWREERYREVEERARKGGLVFGILKSDGTVSPHPPVGRSLAIVEEALRQRGHEVLEWEPPSHSEAADVLFQILGSTAGLAIRAAVYASGERPIPQLAELFSSNNGGEPSSTAEFWKLCSLREQYRSQYHKYWKSTEKLTSSGRHVDGVILPVAAHAAPPEESFKYYAYSAVPSLLDYTTGTVPVTYADSGIDYDIRGYQPLNMKDQENWLLYNRHIFDGAPVGVQVMGQRFQEEKVLALMGVVRDAVAEYRNSRNDAFRN